LYISDNKGDIPGAFPHTSTGNFGWFGWDKALAIQNGIGIPKSEYYVNTISTYTPAHPYSKILQMYNCPGDPLDATLKLPRSSIMSFGYTYSSSGTAKTNDLAPDWTAVPTSLVKSSAGTVYLLEQHRTTSLSDTRYFPGYYTGTAATNCFFIYGVWASFSSTFDNPCHGSKDKPRNNILMYDGHVEAMTLVEVQSNAYQILKFNK
jgi:prepilin-type processing-associated H-X9-DG protein